MLDYPRPLWRPTIVPANEWIIGEAKKRFSGKQFVVFQNGTCVVWQQSPQSFDPHACQREMLAVVTNAPDFKVRKSAAGDFLVTFRGGVGGLMPANILRDHPAVRAEALNGGRLESELFAIDDSGVDEDETLLVAGLYVRARLYQDLESPLIVHVSV
ncbi:MULTISPECIES: hypothetical protein [unclassified Lysobacter]|uniref:hypothetical protein n=1 Tax=unclassified Lysobacter TaxID=2635362 RepID=UPI001BE52AA4|nr:MULTISPECIES: hypothetical protein [unclassified Lysobacter]MBT2745794.1 hypothetical protein [Lysobacter sp. ISL-42]MBT2749647.1 hypothetical protein [Lysobacter sp. ISL-50]MBT2777634.1 hypothetical protein [Lysobacter sp. ISL-54]MBT2782122.1 hypothetical protein [Lysobacter sp. ISL-52]